MCLYLAFEIADHFKRGGKVTKQLPILKQAPLLVKRGGTFPTHQVVLRLGGNGVYVAVFSNFFFGISLTSSFICL